MEDTRKKILFAASEAVPFIKTGGLADVAGSLPEAIDSSRFDVRVVLPKYRVIPQEYSSHMEYLCNYQVPMPGRQVYAGLFRLIRGGVTYYFIDNEYYFSGGQIYEGGIWDLEKYAYFDKAALLACWMEKFRPDVIHCNDWQTGLIPVYLRNEFQDPAAFGDFFWNVRSVMTIHNLKFQGIWNNRDTVGLTGLDGGYFSRNWNAPDTDTNFLKGGLMFADRITTVSSSYAEEIKDPFYGEGLDWLMRNRSDVLSGIVNGIDTKAYDPKTDPAIVKNYDARAYIKAKEANKLALQEELGLTKDPKKFMMVLVSRLTDQKGLDLVECVMEQICEYDLQFVILGTGDSRYENSFRYFENVHKGQVSSNIMYSDQRAHRIYASGNAVLMPSLFEPCGLTQLIGLRYGCLPIVRETGGLRDTVQPYNEFENTGTGFSFANYNAHEMLHSIWYAVKIYYESRKNWNEMVGRAMKQDFSWGNSARRYEELYESM